MSKHAYGVKDMPVWAARAVVDAAKTERITALVEALPRHLQALLAHRRKRNPGDFFHWAEEHPLVLVVTLRIASLHLKDARILEREEYTQAVLLAETVLAVYK